jgi:hypothetical protein
MPTSLSSRGAWRTRAPLFAVIGVQLVLARGLWRGELPLYRDLARLFIPLKHHVWAELQAGRLPQWWPWEGLGMPLASQPIASLFHPTTLLYALLPFQPAFALQLFLPLPFAAWGAWRLARALGQRPATAALSGAAYSLGGYFLSNTEYTFSSLAAAALPFVALGALRLRRFKPRPVLLAIAMALVVLAGDPVLVYLASGLALAFTLRRKRPVPPLIGLATAAALAGLLAAVQLVPAREHFAQSGRALGIIHASTYWALDLRELSGFVVPPHGGPETLYRSNWVGALTALLAVFGALQRSRARVTLLVVAALSLALAAAQALPLWSWATQVVPGWHAFRFPMKAIGPFALVVAILAGRGAETLARRLRRRPVPFALLAGVVLELAWVNGPLLSTAPLPQAPPLAQKLQSLGVSLEGPSYVWRWMMPLDHRDCTGCALATAGPATGALYGLPTTNAYVPGFSLEYRELNVHSEWTWLGPAAPVFGSRYEIVNLDDATGPTLARDDAAKAALIELPGALPRAYLATGVKRFPRSAVPLVLTNAQFHPGDEVAIAEGEDGPPVHEPDGPWVAAAVRRDGAGVRVSGTAERPSVLVLNESYYRGVHAYEDSAELPVFRVNHLARGVSVAPGPFSVRFEFETPGLPLGAALSASGLAVLVTLAAWRRARRATSAPARTA